MENNLYDANVVNEIIKILSWWLAERGRDDCPANYYEYNYEKEETGYPIRITPEPCFITFAKSKDNDEQWHSVCKDVYLWILNTELKIDAAEIMNFPILEGCPCWSNLLSSKVNEMIDWDGTKDEDGFKIIEIDGTTFVSGMDSCEILKEFVKTYLYSLKGISTLMDLRSRLNERIFLKKCKLTGCSKTYFAEIEDDDDVTEFCSSCREELLRNVMSITRAIESKVQKLKYSNEL